MVAGGLDGVDQKSKHLSSTEILQSLMTGRWRTLGGQLPEAVLGLRGATLNNRVFMTGKNISRLNSVKNTNFRLDNKKLFLMH